MVTETRKHALEGIRVIDFSWLLTGPIATKFLGDHGAEVIKIECHARPDEMRGVTPYRDGIPGANRSGSFALVNTSKYGMTLNLNNGQGVEVAKKLIAIADVVIETFTPGTMKRWGLDYDELRKVKPDVILLSMSMQGQTGPFSQQPLLGTYLQAGAGISHLTGWPDREPVGVPNPYLDYISPLFVLVLTMAALDYRQRTGRGQHIDISQIETSLHFLAPTLLDYTANGQIQTRIGNRSRRASPHGAYRCLGKERWCAIAVHTDQEWEALCQVIGKPDWTRDARFATFARRKQNEEELDRLIEEWTLGHSPEEAMSMMQRAGVPAGVVQNGQDLLERDPQLRYRRHFVTLDHPEIGRHTAEAPPFKLSKTPAELRLPAPCLGEHTQHICTQILGMPDEQFVELLAAGAFD